MRGRVIPVCCRTRVSFARRYLIARQNGALAVCGQEAKSDYILELSATRLGAIGQRCIVNTSSDARAQSGRRQ